MTVAFFVPGEPVAKGRARAFVRHGHVAHYTPEKTARYENLVKLAAQQAMAGEPLSGPLSLYCTFALPVPASYSKKRAAACLSGSEWPCKKPDTDNLVKSIKDGCNGVVWKDDCQVVQVYALKVYGGIPGVSVKVEAAQPLLAVRGEVS